MPPIAEIGAIVEVTPLDGVQYVKSKDKYQMISDFSPFYVRIVHIKVATPEIIAISNGYVLSDQVVAVSGDVISGHHRYVGQVATLFLRTDFADWRIDNVSHAGFKVGSQRAILNGRYPPQHPECADIPYPHYNRFAEIDSRQGNEAKRISTERDWKKKAGEDYSYNLSSLEIKEYAESFGADVFLKAFKDNDFKMICVNVEPVKQKQFENMKVWKHTIFIHHEKSGWKLGFSQYGATRQLTDDELKHLIKIWIKNPNNEHFKEYEKA